MKNITVTEQEKMTGILRVIQSLANLIDGLILGLIYLSFLIPPFIQFMLLIGKFIFMPISIGMQILNVILLGVECARAGFPIKQVVNVIASAVFTSLFAIAVIGGLVAATVFALASPIIFAVTCFANTLFRFGAAIYYGYRASHAESTIKQEYKAAVIENLIATAIGVVATIAITGVMVFGSIYCAPLGVMAGIVVAALSLMGIVSSSRNLFKNKQQDKYPESKGVSTDRTATATLQLSKTSSPPPAAKRVATSYSSIRNSSHFHYKPSVLAKRRPCNTVLPKQVANRAPHR